MNLKIILILEDLKAEINQPLFSIIGTFTAVSLHQQQREEDRGEDKPQGCDSINCKKLSACVKGGVQGL